MKNVKTNTILKRPIKKKITVENTYETNQRDKAREQNLRREAAAMAELTRKHES